MYGVRQVKFNVTGASEGGRDKAPPGGRGLGLAWPGRVGSFSSAWVSDETTLLTWPLPNVTEAMKRWEGLGARYSGKHWHRWPWSGTLLREAGVPMSAERRGVVTVEWMQAKTPPPLLYPREPPPGQLRENHWTA